MTIKQNARKALETIHQQHSVNQEWKAELEYWIGQKLMWKEGISFTQFNTEKNRCNACASQDTDPIWYRDIFLIDLVVGEIKV